MHFPAILCVPGLLSAAPSALPLRASIVTARASPWLLGGDAADAAELAALIEEISTSVRAFEAEEMAAKQNYESEKQLAWDNVKVSQCAGSEF